MNSAVRYEVRDRVAVIIVDNPPVNALGAGVPEGISEAVERACGDAAADAIVLIGAGTTFIAGADITVFKQLKTREQSIERSGAMHARLKALEDARKPLVAAIHGHALGGGLEFAVACHYRVAVATANVGQPEVHLGIIPGAGGTQRLPRLCGAALALEMCTDGKPVAAPRAHSAGIVDAVIDDEIIARIMTALANEGARVLEEGYAARASDIDVVYVHGFGFPRHRGGPMFYADTVGLATVLARVTAYRQQFGDYWRPSPLLERLASERRGFHGDPA
jgi:3-hydroxyacyl-CoA dehydrogenase